MALRKLRPVQVRFWVAAVAVAGSVVFLWLGAMVGSRGIGRVLDQGLCLAGLYCVMRAPMLTAGALAEERRNGTLGLLFLSGLGPMEVFASKFLSSALVAFTNLLAFFPMLALPFLLGGVSFDTFLATVCGLPTLMLFALSMSLLASALTREEGAATILAVTLGVLICGMPPLLHAAQNHFSTGFVARPWWLLLSPAYGASLAWNSFRSGFNPGDLAAFWRNLAVTAGLSIVALAVAAVALKRMWRERDDAFSGGTAFDAIWRKRRARLAKRWLEANPFAWLASREWKPCLLGWAVVGGMTTAWLLCWAAWPARWLSVQNFFVTATLLNAALAWLIRHAAAKELGLARQNGAYELLLTTPLEPRQIVEGQLAALREYFRGPANFVFLANAAMMVAGLGMRTFNGVALVEYFLIWAFLLTWSWSQTRWMSRVLPVMWASLNCGRPALAVWRTSGFNGGSWFWIVFNLNSLTRGLGEFPRGSGIELVAVTAFGIFMGGAWIARQILSASGSMADAVWDPKTKTWTSTTSKFTGHRVYELRLIREFREIVQEQVPEAGDARFKLWNPKERFPSKGVDWNMLADQG